MPALVEICIHSVLTTISFIYDTITLPIYWYFQQPGKVLKDSERVKAKVISKDANHIAIKSTLPIGRQHVLVEREKLDTMEKIFLQVSKTHQHKKCMGTRQILREESEVQPNGQVLKKYVMGAYQWRSFIDAETEALHFARGMRELGVKPRERVVIFAETRAEWMIAAQGFFKISCGIATIYATLGEEGIIYALNQTEVSTVVTSHELMPKMKNVLKDLPNIKNIVYFEDQLQATSTEGFGKVKVLPYKNVIALGKGSRFENVAPNKDDLAILMYTSGSTGVPKGVLLTHKNLVATMKGFLDMLDDIRPYDVYLGLLPLAHCYELLVECACFLAGIPIGYSTPLTLIDTSLKIAKGSSGDAGALQPTLMTGVPLLLDRITKGINDKVSNGPLVKKCLFNFAFNYKKKWTRKGYSTPIIDAIVFKKVAKLIGGKLRLMVSGGAPLSPGTHETIRITLCVTMIQGYGATETTAGGTAMEVLDRSTGRSGSPCSCNIVKLVNWEEGNYFVTNKPFPQGEILIGGDNITDGYFKMPKETEEAFYEENGVRWFRTGDIGEIHDDGGVKIIDRKKDLVKLQHGEYISLGKVEAELKTCPIVENLCIYCDSTKTYCIALVQPAEKGLNDLANSLGVKGSYSELFQNSQIINAATTMISEYGKKKKKLNKFEIPKKIALCEDQWLPETGLVTAAFKIRRKEVAEKYKDVIKKLYV